MSSDVYQKVRKALNEKSQVHAKTRDGHRRELCPHVIGHSNGEEQALFCQFGGTSKKDGRISSNNPRWRCMRLSDLVDVSIVAGKEWFKAKVYGVRPPSCVDDVDLFVP